VVVTVHNPHTGRDARLELVEGDITDQEADAIVNAAHWDLAGGQGVDGRIHYVGGPSILEECRRIGGCPTGDAVVTGAGRLKARYVIHAVGPVFEENSDLEADLLGETYKSSLRRAAELGLDSVALPSLSTGAFCYPMPLAAPVAARALLSFLRDEPRTPTSVRLVLYPQEAPEAYRIYADALGRVLHEEPEFAAAGVVVTPPTQREHRTTGSSTQQGGT
jgi:O-acetyl-ADP-ribose deacetylase